MLPRDETHAAQLSVDTFDRPADRVGAWSYSAARAIGVAATSIELAPVSLSLAWGGGVLRLGQRQRQLERADCRSKIED